MKRERSVRKTHEAVSHDHMFGNVIAGVLLSGGVAAAVFGFAVGPAQADSSDPFPAQPHFVSADDPDPPPPPRAPPPFCTPRGGLFIVGPICDEIGVGPPERTAPAN
jgi:hypothetical protein